MPPDVPPRRIGCHRTALDINPPSTDIDIPNLRSCELTSRDGPLESYDPVPAAAAKQIGQSKAMSNSIAEVDASRVPVENSQMESDFARDPAPEDFIAEDFAKS
jgi:hypothetical protein